MTLAFLFVASAFVCCSWRFRSFFRRHLFGGPPGCWCSLWRTRHALPAWLPSFGRRRRLGRLSSILSWRRLAFRGWLGRFRRRRGRSFLLPLDLSRRRFFRRDRPGCRRRFLLWREFRLFRGSKGRFGLFVRFAGWLISCHGGRHRGLPSRFLNGHSFRLSTGRRLDRGQSRPCIYPHFLCASAS